MNLFFSSSDLHRRMFWLLETSFLHCCKTAFTFPKHHFHNSCEHDPTFSSFFSRFGWKLIRFCRKFLGTVLETSFYLHRGSMWTVTYFLKERSLSFFCGTCSGKRFDFNHILTALLPELPFTSTEHHFETFFGTFSNFVINFVILDEKVWTFSSKFRRSWRNAFHMYRGTVNERLGFQRKV